MESLADAAAEKGLVLRSRIRDCWILTDPALLHRILINLVGNAIRHTHRGSILVACRRCGDTARIEVWDTGPGIPPEAREAIFDELVQLDNPERDPEKGLGLGLAIVRKSAELLDHPLTLCSRVGQGSRFALTVPLAAVPVGMGTFEERPVPAQPPLLLIGPPSPEQEELVRLLDNWHFTVTRLADPESAQFDRDGLPRGVILALPDGAAGVERSLAWLDRIAADTGQPLPALIISSGPTPALEEPPDGTPRLLLTRPFRPARLRALLDRLLAHHETPE
jgi:hypothetical protein